jgi:hypothetical protein
LYLPVVINGAFKHVFEAEAEVEEEARGGEVGVGREESKESAETVAGAAWAQDGWR